MSKSLLVLGGSGSLGSEIVRFFKSNGWKTISVDFRKSDIAEISLTITSSNEDQMKSIENELTSQNIKVDALVCAAGGWTGGDSNSDGYLDSVKKMIDMNLYSAFGAAFLGAKLLKPNGLIVLTGSLASIKPTSFMIAYGATKAATHHIVKSLAQPDSGLPANSTAVCILPQTLDTPANRSAMAGANFNDWTPLTEVAEKLYEWSEKVDTRPTSGSLIGFETKNKSTTWAPICLFK
ncbi:hypothetical protein CYY_006639 [Polysphondylium violaceum]|uniref:Dihydropteridine reductase n=1 Tax=Polysphondylium violaceum TaxID=133409 RepID=A0A8J4PT50_9MYCE|nr:hypothetical protein CYY_006639 [Polysphondylium violaceum]